MPKVLTHDLTSEGFALFDERGVKVAVIGCVTDGPKVVRVDPETKEHVTDPQGHVIKFPTFKGLPRSSWGIHLTSPSISVELLEAILAAIPKGDDHTQHDSVRKAM